jgi:predicted amidohydrolase
MTFPLDRREGAVGGNGRVVRVGLAQVRFRSSTQDFDARDTNLAQAIPAIREAAGRGAKLVVIGELFLQGPGSREWGARYATQPSLDDPHVAELAKLAAELDVTIAMGCIARGSFASGDAYNAALVVTPAGLAGVFRKCHLANFPYEQGVSNELSFYSAGTDLSPIDTPAGRLGVHICYDIFFPEVARAQALSGAEYMVNLAAAGETFEHYWDHLCWARAVENGSWYLLCSVVGGSTERAYFGGSRIVAPDGEVVARARDYEEDILVADIDLERSWSMRSGTHMFSARQPAAYAAITQHRRT